MLGLIEQSTPERTVWNVERLRAGKPADWNYIDGCMMTALIAMADITGEKKYFDFAKAYGVEPWVYYSMESTELYDEAIANGARLFTANDPAWAINYLRSKGLHK